MSTHSHAKQKQTALFSILLILPAIVLFILWVTSGYDGISDGEHVDTFMSYFPSWISNSKIVHVVSVICCIGAIGLASGSFKKKMLSIRVLMLFVVLIAFFILLFDIYLIM